MIITRPAILDVLEKKGFAVFDGDNYDLNLIGIRSKQSKSKKKHSNEFDDLMVCVYKINGEWHQETWKITTDPGVYWLEDEKRKGNPKGTAILVPGQYRGCWIIAMHRQKYKALCQRNTGDPMRVYRDKNKDKVLDFDESSIMEIRYSINCHRAHPTKIETEYIGPYSAGCQVFKRVEDFDRLMWLAGQQIRHNPTYTKFSYTLIDE